MRALITGGLGFIGSNLADKLLEKKYRVVIVDNCQSNAVPKKYFINKCRVQVPHTAENYCFSIWDGSFDYIFHLANAVGPAGVLKYAGEMGYTTLAGIKNMVKVALKMNAKLIDVSTSEVYGKNGYLSEEEDKIVSSKTTVRMEYGLSKLLGEVILENTAKVNPFKYNIIRPFNVAGPRQQPDGGFVTPRFVRQALKNEPITVFDKGQQLRTFTHVYDIVDGLILAAEKEVNGEIFNLGNANNKISILEYAQLIKEITGSKSEIVFTSGKEIYGDLYEEAWDKMAISEKAERMLGWKPTRDLRTIVEDYVKYYKEKK